MEKREKITDGTNDRPLNDTIGQTGTGIPDDSGTVPDISEEEFARQRDALLGKDKAKEKRND